MEKIRTKVTIFHIFHLILKEISLSLRPQKAILMGWQDGRNS